MVRPSRDEQLGHIPPLSFVALATAWTGDGRTGVRTSVGIGCGQPRELGIGVCAPATTNRALSGPRKSIKKGGARCFAHSKYSPLRFFSHNVQYAH